MPGTKFKISPGEYLEKVFAAIQHPFYIIDADNYLIVKANGMVGGEAVIGRPCHEVTHRNPNPCTEPEHLCPLAEVKRTGKMAMTEHIHYDGEGKSRNIRVYGFPLSDDNDRVAQMIVYGFDITDLRQKKRELTRSRDFYLTILEEFPALIWRAGTDAKCNYFNRGWLAFTGRTLAQENGDGWAESVHPDDLPRCLAVYREAFAARQPFSMEYRLRRHDGTWRWIVDHGRPIVDTDNIFAGYIGACYDIHDQRENAAMLENAKAILETSVAERTAELENSYRELNTAYEKFQATHAQLLHAEKLATVGELAAGLSHEFKNRLAVISSAVYYLRGSIPADDAGAKISFGHIENEIERATRLINDLLQFSRSKPLQVDPVAVDQLLNLALLLIDKAIRSQGIIVEQRYAPDSPPVQADADQIQQVFMNLLLNAVQAMPGGGTLTLTTETVYGNSGQPAQVLVRVKDTGVGIPDKIRNRIFDPFFSTKHDKNGTGLGLAISYGIISAHGGTIEVASEPGCGSEFTVTLPVCLGGTAP